MFLSKKETILTILLFSTLCQSVVYAEITLGILSGIRDNSMLYLNDSNRHVECVPFGIKTLEMIKEEVKDPECTNSINAYFFSHPHEKVYAQEHLHLYQKYHYEQNTKGCVLYSNGPESYSEQLLNEGLAIPEPKFDDSEWNAKLRKAHMRAKVLKKGIFEGDTASKCIKGENTP